MLSYTIGYLKSTLVLRYLIGYRSHHVKFEDPCAGIVEITRKIEIETQHETLRPPETLDVQQPKDYPLCRPVTHRLFQNPPE